ncbi:unnamed protein product, partial [Prorocentrum cordatum]
MDSMDTPKGRGKGNVPEPQPIALDEKDWTVPVAQAPTKTANGDYQSSVSLHSTVDAEKWCSALQRQKGPLAILATGTRNPQWPHAKVQIPVLNVPHGAKVPRKNFLDGVIYQFGETEVQMRTNLAQLEAADGTAVFMRMTIHEADALLVNPTIEEVFSSQFSGAAPIVTGGNKRDKLGSTANERWKQARRSDAKLSLDVGLKEVNKSTLSAICPDIELLDDPGRLLRAGGQDGQRSLGALLAIETSQELALLKYSGYQGITFAFSYIGASPEKQKEAHSLAKSHEAALGITKGVRGQFGLRVLRSHPQAPEAATAIRGTAAALAGRKWRTGNIPNGRATKSQIQDSDQSVGWTTEVAHVGFDATEKTNYAIARSDTEPANKYWKFGASIPWVVTEITPGNPAAGRGDPVNGPAVVLAAALPAATPPAPPSGTTPASMASVTPPWLAALRGRPPEVPAAAAQQDAAPEPETKGPMPPPAPVRPPDAEHQRFQALEASARAQAAALEAMQTTIAKQETATAALGAKLNDVAQTDH